MAASFPKHDTFRNKSYLPLNVTAYTGDANHGEILAIYYPAGTTADYPDLYKAGDPWIPFIFYQSAGFSVSAGNLSDATNQNITTTQGYIWQLTSLGFAVVVAQITPADAAFAAVSGRGFFNPPGETGAYYESLTRPNAWKDAIHVIQHVRFFRRLYGFGMRVGVGGDSSGAVTAAWLALGPNRARELGSGGQYDMPTHPNFYIGDRIPGIFHWDAYDQATGAFAVAFPLAAGGNVVATDLSAIAGGGAAATRFRLGMSTLGYSPMFGKRTTSTLTRIGSLPKTTNFYLPVVTGNPELGLHTGYHGFAARTNLGRLRDARQGATAAYSISLMVASAITAPAAWDVGHGTYGLGSTVSYLLPGVYYYCIQSHTAAAGKEPTNASFWAGPIVIPTTDAYDGQLDSLDADGQAGLLTGTVVDFVKAHARDENVCFLADREPWTWAGQVETGGRNIVSPYPRSRTVRVTCTDATNSLKVAATSGVLQGQVTLAPGATAEWTTDGGVFALAAAATSTYEVEEIVN